MKSLLRFSLFFLATLSLFLITRHYTQPAYRGLLTDLGSAVLGTEAADRTVRLDREAGALDSAIHLVHHGNPPVEMILAFDSTGLGWTPTVLLLCLITATPLPWRRKLGPLLIGSVLVHLYILISLWFYLQAHLADVGLAQHSLGVARVLGGLEDELIGQIGPGLFVPVACWVIVTFRQTDLINLFSGARNHPA